MANQVVGSLPAVDRFVPSSEGGRADVGNPALTNLPPFCRVIANLSPVPKSKIFIELWLPGSWNGKLLAVGNHGWGGEFERGYMAMALERGYAVVATDMGHSRKASPEAQFAIGDDVAVDDFAGRAVHEMTVAAKRLVQSNYGAAARRAYFFGCSMGGRAGMTEAQRFPRDYDGIIAGGAPISWTRFNASVLWQYKAGILDTGGRISAAKLDLVSKRDIAACDAQDGAADGLLADPMSCRSDLRYVECKPADNPANCLTAAEVASVTRVRNPPKDPATGKELYPGPLPGSEGFWLSSLDAERLNRIASTTVGFYRDMVLHDPAWTWDSTDVMTALRASEQPDSQAVKINSINPDLSAFNRRGGKLIQYHGWNENMSPVYNLVYYAEVIDLQPGPDRLAQTQDFYRLFMVPGMGHCGGGMGPVNFGGLNHTPSPQRDPDHDILEALDRWVEKGVAPDKIIATRFEGDAGPQRQMPLCPYPKVAIYTGGDINRAENFACRVSRPPE